MTLEERPFSPEEVDARIDDSSSTLRPDAPEAIDQRLLPALRSLYAAEAREMDNALARGRARLSQSLVSLAAPEPQDSLPGDALAVPTEQQSAPPSLQLLRAARRWPVRLASLAAAILLVVLVGGLVAGLVLVRHPSQGHVSKPVIPAQPSATTPSAPPQENLYLLTAQDGSIVKIDTQSRSVLWTYTWKSPQDSSWGYSAPLVGDGIVYFSAGAGSGSDGFQMSIYALNAQTGALLWNNTSLPNGPTILLAEHGVVYVNAGSDLYALNASDGSTRWHALAGGGVEHLVLAQGILYGATFDTTSAGQWTSTLFAVSAADGALLWQATQPIGKSFTVEAVIDGTMYLTSVEEKYPTGGEKSIGSDGKPKISYVYAYSLTGKPLWQSQPFDGFLTNLSIGDGAIYFAGDEAYALSTKDGTLLWDYQVAPAVIEYPGPFFANGTVYLESGPNGSDSSIPSVLIALDGQTGHVQWQQQLASTFGGEGVAAPALGNGFLYVVLPEYPSTSVEAFNASDGSFAWQTSVKEDLGSWMIVAP